MLRPVRKQNAKSQRARGRAPLRRPGAVAISDVRAQRSGFASAIGETQVYGHSRHPLTRQEENNKLLNYEDRVKQAFEQIVPTLKLISAMQHESDFVSQAQVIAQQRFEFELPSDILESAWVQQLDMRRLFAWCVFNIYKNYCDEYFASQELFDSALGEFNAFLQSCGFHTLDITPCADGRLAHLIRYVLRLPPRAVRRKSYAGATFDIEDSIEKWMEIELQRFREGKPNSVEAPTRYLKVVAYHFSSNHPLNEGCAAHGSNTEKAAMAGLQRLINFRQAIENGFCCGASIDLLLMGVDTDTDSLRIHIPDDNGQMEIDRFIDTKILYAKTSSLDQAAAKHAIESSIRQCSPQVSTGMANLIAYLVENNFSQIAYVHDRHGTHYPDIGHAERFIGAGVGFEDIQLRNLMYFAYLNTVEEGAADLDVGIKIFKALNVSKGLPVPVIVRFDYHGSVPGAKDRAEQRCGRVARALYRRYSELYQQGLLHVMQVARDCDTNNALQIVDCSVHSPESRGH